MTAQHLLSPAPDACPAQWLSSCVDIWADDWATGLVGPDFTAYARIFHPLDPTTRWADIAIRQGKKLFADTRWAELAAGIPPPRNLSERIANPAPPALGCLNQDEVSALCDILANHTTTSDMCYFAVWDGWAWWEPGAGAALTSTVAHRDSAPSDRRVPNHVLSRSAPKFSVPGRSYYLFRGPLEGALHVGYWLTDGYFAYQSPSFFWPNDRAWCVATEIDDDSSCIGGTKRLVRDVVASRLEALPITDDD